MSDTQLAAVASRFRVLAEPARLRLLRVLLAGEHSVGELVEKTSLSQANASKHLSTLHAARFVDRRKVGTTVYYSVTDTSVHELCDLMCAHVAARARADAHSVGSHPETDEE